METHKAYLAHNESIEKEWKDHFPVIVLLLTELFREVIVGTVNVAVYGTAGSKVGGIVEADRIQLQWGKWGII